MNHQEFRTLVKTTSKDVIKSWGVKPANFVAVCMVLSMYGDYETGTNIRPSWLTVANEAGVDRKTAMKIRDILISNDLLVQKGTTEGNIAIYEFGSVVQLESRQLSNSDEQLSNSEDQLSSIDGHNITYNTTSNTTITLLQQPNGCCENQEDLDSPSPLDFKGISSQEMYKITSHLWA